MELISAITERSNMLQAYQRVCRNKGAPGLDGMTTGELKGYLQIRWLHIKQHLMEGSYQPQPVRKVEIPKPGCRMRMLGIPCVIDRLIQQAVHQVLIEQFEPMFSPHSYGFRPSESRHLNVADIKDNPLLKLTFPLKAGIMENGIATARTEGTPQG